MANPFGQKNDRGYCICSDNELLREPGCGRTFSSLAAFDAHLRANHSVEDFREKAPGVWTATPEGSMHPRWLNAKPRRPLPADKGRRNEQGSVQDC